MLSSSTPFLVPRDICLENHVLNIPFMKSFARLRLHPAIETHVSCSVVSPLTKRCYLSARPKTCQLFVLKRRHI